MYAEKRMPIYACQSLHAFFVIPTKKKTDERTNERSSHLSANDEFPFKLCEKMRFKYLNNRFFGKNTAWAESKRWREEWKKTQINDHFHVSISQHAVFTCIYIVMTNHVIVQTIAWTLVKTYCPLRLFRLVFFSQWTGYAQTWSDSRLWTCFNWLR